MGRKLMRVPMDFSWPLNEVWGGYVNPYHVRCPACDGDGQTRAYRRLERISHLIAASGDEARRGRVMVNRNEFDGEIASPEFTALVEGLGSRLEPFGYDYCSIFLSIVKAAGLDDKWGLCPSCNGEGVPLASQAAYNAWEEEPPPKGEGYQLWETTSEGSPVSPVFASLDELCEYAATNCTTFADCKATAEAWKRMLEEDFVRHEQGNMIFI
jgi:hypothetical protein